MDSLKGFARKEEEATTVFRTSQKGEEEIIPLKFHPFRIFVIDLD